MSIKRVYDPPSQGDGRRFLVDRLWPRGITRDALALDDWLRDAAPSHALRREFKHDPARWPEFVRAYHAELEAQPEAWQPILDALGEGAVTLLYAARDRERNNARALLGFLDRKAQSNP